MKTLTLIFTLLALSSLAACQSAPLQKSAAATTNGKQLGNTGVYASGSLEAGGSVSNH